MRSMLKIAYCHTAINVVGQFAFQMVAGAVLSTKAFLYNCIAHDVLRNPFLTCLICTCLFANNFTWRSIWNDYIYLWEISAHIFTIDGITVSLGNCTRTAVAETEPQEFIFLR